MSRIYSSLDSMTLHRGQVRTLLTKPNALQPGRNSGTWTSARTTLKELVWCVPNFNKKLLDQSREIEKHTSIIKSPFPLKGARRLRDVSFDFRSVVNGWYTPLCSLSCLPIALHVVLINLTSPDSFGKACLIGSRTNSRVEVCILPLVQGG